MEDKQGICPICGSVELEYGVIEVDGEVVMYPWECKGNNCTATGKECYNLEFTEHASVEK